MSTEERDTHFAGFAKLLLEKLKPDLALLLMEVNRNNPDAIEKAERIIAGVIAESTYDPVKYVMENTKSGTLETAHFYFDESVSDIPDMTAWPEQSE